MLSKDVQDSISESVLCWLATVGQDGRPNVSPKELFLAYSENEIIIANIASPASVKNLRQNLKVCVSFIHVFKQKGFKVHGLARYLTEKIDGYKDRHSLLYNIVGDKFPIRGVISVKVTSVTAIVAPSYNLPLKVTESQQVERAKKKYGV